MVDFYCRTALLLEGVTLAEQLWLKHALDICSYLEGEEKVTKRLVAMGMSSSDDVTYNWPPLHIELHVSRNEVLLYTEEYLNIDAAIELLSSFLKRFRPTGALLLEWSYDASKPDPDAFGGGAGLITAAGMEKYISTREWATAAYDQWRDEYDKKKKQTETSDA